MFCYRLRRRAFTVGLLTPLLAALATLVLAACNPAPPRPTAVPATSPTPGPGTPSATPRPTATPASTSTPAPTPTPLPLELVVCQADEPASLYLYGDDVSARAGIFDALFDGPIDSAGFGHQPVILLALPSPAAGTAGLQAVEVQPGERVVDGQTGALVPLGEGVQLRQMDGTLVPYAGSGPASTVQTWAEFTLRPDVSWSDGEPVTADDSVFSFEIAASPDTRASKYVVDRTARYEAVDVLKTRWSGLPGWLDSDYALRFWTPLPRHRYGEHSALELNGLAEINEAPLGWGPFIAQPDRWVKGAQLTLVRNPHYFRAAEGLPRLDQVTFRFGLSTADIVAQVASGGCDIGLSTADFSQQWSEVLEAQSAGRLTAQIVPDTAFEHLDFGIQPADGYKRAAGNDLFQDVRVRQAMAYCLDRKALVDQLLGGLAEVPAVYVPSIHPAYAGGQLVQYPFDPARGQALLDEAGWQDADGDGVRDKARRRLSLDLASAPADSEFRQALLQFIATQLKDNCGVEARPSVHTPAELYDPWPKGIVFGRRFDLGVFPWRTGIEPPCDLYESAALPSDQNPGGVNDTGYANPAFDAACQASQEALDEAARRQHALEAQVIFTQDLPSLPLFYRPKIGLVGPRVQGYQLDSTAASDLWNVESIALARP